MKLAISRISPITFLLLMYKLLGVICCFPLADPCMLIPIEGAHQNEMIAPAVTE